RRTAQAAPAPAPLPPPPPPIEPPRALSRDEPIYPSGETASVTVIIEVVVEVDGTTSASHVIEGREPFATAALDAVARYRFAAASRGGIPIRARIRLAVGFTAPEAKGDPNAQPPEVPVA